MTIELDLGADFRHVVDEVKNNVDRVRARTATARRCGATIPTASRVAIVRISGAWTATTTESQVVFLFLTGGAAESGAPYVWCQRCGWRPAEVEPKHPRKCRRCGERPAVADGLLRAVPSFVPADARQLRSGGRRRCRTSRCGRQAGDG